MSFFQELKTLFRSNIREYGMFIALFFIMIIFSVLTNGVFLSPRNMSNLINSTGYIAVLAVGMTLVIVIKHIDLSVGFLAGFIGAVTAIFITQHNIPIFIAVLAVLVIGLIVGLISGFFVDKIGMPSFVVSLAGMLIFRGYLIQVTQKTGTIIIPNAGFNAIGNGFIPDISVMEGYHFVTIILGVLGIGLFIYNEYKIRKNKIYYNFKVVSKPIYYAKLIFVSLVIGYVTSILSRFNGLSFTVVIVIAVVFIYHYLTTKTVLGRHVYAVGGNMEAAKLSGISVSKITYFVFGSMGMLAALSGILYTSRIQAATVTAGTLFELDAIAAAYVGGVSSSGGVGKVTGSIVGAFVMSSLTNGMNLMGVDISYQYMIRGSVLLIAVAFDVLSRNKR